jgi:hypothetical protein
MAHQDINDYVTGQIAQGVPAKIVKDALLGAGWLEADADNAIRDAAAGTAPAHLTSLQDDLQHVRHAVNELDQRVQRIEGRLAVVGPGEGTLETGFIGPDHELDAGEPGVHRNLIIGAFAVLFFVAGYLGMMLISTETLTPVTRVWVEAALGCAVGIAGFIVGRQGRRVMANVMTGIGLALVSLATVGAWYLLYLDWTIALALGALFVTLALVLGRFYDRWAKD